MSLLRAIWLRLDDLQRRRGVRIGLSALVLLLCAAWFGTIFMTGRSLERDRTALVSALREANLTRGDAVAVEFSERGTVVLGTRTFGGPAVARTARSMYQPDGTIANAAAAARLLLEDRLPGWAPAFLLEQPDTLILLAVAVLAVLLLTIWSGLVVPFLATLVGALLATVPFVLAGNLAWTVAIAGIAILLYVFFLLVRVAAFALSRPRPIFAIASNVLRESMRLRIATFFAGTVLVLIPLLPIWIDPNDPLRYQVQTFLSRSTGLLFFLAACLTIFLACATVAFEIRDRQIWQLMTKPVARVQYLTGKWLGVVVLNVILLAVGGVSIFVYVQFMRTRPALDLYDAVAVRDEVLVARETVTPQLRLLRGEELRELVERKIQSDILLKGEIESGEKREVDVKRELARQITTEYLAAQRSIPAGDERSFVFDGLARARKQNATITLRYSFDIGAIDPHESHAVIFAFGEEQGGPAIQRYFVAGQPHVLAVTPEVIDEDGRLTVSIFNGGAEVGPQGEQVLVPGIGTAIFRPGGFEVLYRVDGFEPNFIRAMLVNLLKLAFLAMLGTVAATVLSFPVATMLCFTVLVIGGMGPFLGISIADYEPTRDAPMLWQWFQLGIKGVAGGAEWLLRGFGEVRANTLLVEGRIVPYSAVLRTLVVIGFVWTGGVFLLGYLAFRRKELAVYSGQS